MWYPSDGIASEGFYMLEGDFSRVVPDLEEHKDVERLSFLESSPEIQPRTSRSDHDEGLVSVTENARLNAWRTAEAMMRASHSGLPSRVGSATTRRSSHRSETPPPQRPSSPTLPGAVPIRQADKWLAGGQDVNTMNAKHLSAPLPGWMEGLEVVRRPKSSPVSALGRRR